MTNRYAQALDTGKFSVESVCIDCYLAHHGYDGQSDDWDSAAYDATVSTYDVTEGHPHQSEHYTDCPHDGEECPDDCDCGYSHFDAWPCGMCESRLAGERYDMTYIRREYLEGW